MGKRLPQAYALIASQASQIKSPNLLKPPSKSLAPPPKLPKPMEEGSREARVRLSEVVSDCVKRWFQDTLKEARNGDHSMQVLVGQMYQSGYGVARNEQKAMAWINKASKYRSSAWKVSDKHPGYNASDSDSDEVANQKN